MKDRDEIAALLDERDNKLTPEIRAAGTTLLCGLQSADLEDFRHQSVCKQESLEYLLEVERRKVARLEDELVDELAALMRSEESSASDGNILRRSGLRT